MKQETQGSSGTAEEFFRDFLLEERMSLQLGVSQNHKVRAV